MKNNEGEDKNLDTVSKSEPGMIRNVIREAVSENEPGAIENVIKGGLKAAVQKMELYIGLTYLVTIALLFLKWIGIGYGVWVCYSNNTIQNIFPELITSREVSAIVLFLEAVLAGEAFRCGCHDAVLLKNLSSNKKKKNISLVAIISVLFMLMTIAGLTLAYNFLSATDITGLLILLVSLIFDGMIAIRNEDITCMFNTKESLENRAKDFSATPAIMEQINKTGRYSEEIAGFRLDIVILDENEKTGHDNA